MGNLSEKQTNKQTNKQTSCSPSRSVATTGLKNAHEKDVKTRLRISC